MIVLGYFEMISGDYFRGNFREFWGYFGVIILDHFRVISEDFGVVILG